MTSRLSEYIHTQSEGKYILTIKEIKRSLIPFSIQFKEVNLEPADYDIYDQGLKKEELLYHFGATEIRMDGIKVAQLLTEKTLSGDLIKITRPEVKLAGEELLKVDSLNISPHTIRNLWPLFGFIEKVEIKKIELEEANFGFYSAAGDSGFISRAEKVAVDIHGFKSSALMANNQERFFETEDILVRINDLRNDMGDSLHVLTIDTLLYSLKTTDISVHGFHLLPYTYQPSENLFEVHVPEVYVKSRSIAHFALSDSVKIGFIEFKKPQIKFFHKSQPQKLAIEHIDDFDLYSLIKNQFLKLEVDSFYLQSASLEIYRQPDVNNYRQQFQSIDIVLNGFELDSTSYQNQKKLFHADNLEMHVKGYHLKMEDNEHHFRAGSVFASTFTNQLIAGDINIQPENVNNTSSRNEIDIECKLVNIEEVNFLDLYHRRILPTSVIQVIEPNVHLLYKLEKEKKQKQDNTGLLFEMVTDYLQGVYAQTVSVERGRLNIRNNLEGIVKGYFETDINFHLADFSLDSTSIQESSNFFYASNFELQFSDYNMRLIDDFHKLEVDSLFISSHNNQVLINNISLQPVIENVGLEDMIRSGNSEMYRIFVPQISLHSVNLRNAFFNQRISIENFNISSPEIYFENFNQLRNNTDKQELSEIYALIFNYIDDIDIKRFSIHKGLLTWINHSRNEGTTTFDNEFSVSLQNFRLNENELTKKRLLFSDDFDLTIKDQEFELSDDVHILKGSEIRFSSSESKINVKDALLFPLITSESYLELASTWQIAIPEIKIEGFNFHEAYFSQKPQIQVVELVKPRLQLYMQPDKTKGLDMKAFKIPMPSFIQSLNISELKISDGEVITYRKERTRHQAMANFFFSLSVPGIELSNNEDQQIQIASNNIFLSISDFRIPVDEVHNLHIDKIEFDREKKFLDVFNLQLSPFITDNRLNRFSITAPSIQFKEFDFHAALNNNDFIFSGIEASNPEITIAINKKAEDDSLEFLQTLDLYPYVEHLVNSVQIKHLDIRNAHLNFDWLQKSMFNNKVNLSFEGIQLGENQPPNNLLNSQSFTISTTNLAARSKDEMYEFTIDSLIYKSSRNSVRLQNLGITPLADKRRFQLKTGYQTDVVNAKIEFVEFTGINEKRWLQDNVLDARKLLIGTAVLDIYRNKRFPFNDKQRPEWPQNHIKKLNQPFVFDSVVLLNSRIKYSELLPIFDEPGTVEFTEFKLQGGRLTNIIEELNKNKIFHLNAEARLQNEGLLKAQFAFDMKSPDYEHTVKGSLGPMPLTPLNTMLMKTAPVAVESGSLNRLDFNISFKGDTAQGEMYMVYDNLRIAVLDYSNEDAQKAWLTSFLANRLKINNQNQGGNTPKPVNIEHDRDESRSIFNFWWKSLYSGVVKVIGL